MKTGTESQPESPVGVYHRRRGRQPTYFAGSQISGNLQFWPSSSWGASPCHSCRQHSMTPGNWSALLLQVSVEVIVAIGMTILLVSGGFDLSVGSTFAISGAVTAMALVSGVPTILAIAMGLLLGTVIGFINGFIIARIGINPFVTTLAMMSIVRGMLLVVTRGGNISGLPADFRFIGEGHLAGYRIRS